MLIDGLATWPCETDACVIRASLLCHRRYAATAFASRARTATDTDLVQTPHELNAKKNIILFPSFLLFRRFNGMSLVTLCRRYLLHDK